MGKEINTSKFDFYEIVRVCSKDAAKNEIFGKEGIVRAKGQNDKGEWTYTVAIKDDFAWSMSEVEIESLGRFADKQEYSKRDILKVYVNEDGEGFLNNENK